jgi:hypothetical protein
MHAGLPDVKPVEWRPGDWPIGAKHNAKETDSLLNYGGNARNVRGSTSHNTAYPLRRRAHDAARFNYTQAGTGLHDFGTAKRKG